MQNYTWPKELEDKRALRSFEDLYQYCLKRPSQALSLLCSLANCQDPYPFDISVVFLMGMLQATLFCAKAPPIEIMKSIIAHHSDAFFLKSKPGDYMGDKRKMFRSRRGGPPHGA